MSLQEINTADKKRAYQLFESCCCAPNWVDKMIAARPFTDQTTLLAEAKIIWQNLTETDYLAAFEGHPQIGDISTLQDKYANTSSTAGHEQSGMSSAQESVIDAMFTLNKAYLAKFGFIFIVFASGKSAEQMLALLKARIDNDRDTELTIAASEQAKITANRLEKLL
jgi:2-oxo-4-hydroxy-4-carboxy-5-ureidoimidazoline decarboxylase